ncbi:MAG: PIN domain-containing protein [Thermoanaerobaculia bacterium]
MPIASVVADANVLLSAAIGKAALRVMTEFEVAVHAARFNAEEVAEYLPLMATKYRLPLELVEMQWKLLPIEVHEFEDYRRWFGRAHAELAARDPEDAHALALARSLGLPLWSNDRDLEGFGVERYTTARLLSVLQRERESAK